MHKIKLTKTLLLFIAIMLSNLNAKSYDDDLPPLGIDTMKAVAYTKEFAERFGLPESGISDELKNGLQAVEFSVEKHITKIGTLYDFYTTMFKFYFTDNDSVSYPKENKSCNKDYLLWETHFFYTYKY